jgi:hypothetical protein
MPQSSNCHLHPPNKKVPVNQEAIKQDRESVNEFNEKLTDSSMKTSNTLMNHGIQQWIAHMNAF